MPGLFGDSGGDTTVSNEPPAFQLPFLEAGLDASLSLLDNPPEVFTGPGVAPLSQDTTDSFAAGRNTAGDLDVLAGASGNAFIDSLNTDVASNPEFQALVESLTGTANENLFENILPQIDTTSAGVGAFGGSDAAFLKAQGIGDTQTAITRGTAELGGSFFSTLSAGRNNSLANIPGLIAGQLAPSSLLGVIGAQQDQRSQNELNDAIGVFERVNSAPEEALDRFISRVHGNLGNVTTTEGGGRSDFGNALTSGLGTGLVASGLGLSNTTSGIAGLLGALAGIV